MLMYEEEEKIWKKREGMISYFKYIISNLIYTNIISKALEFDCLYGWMH